MPEAIEPNTTLPGRCTVFSAGAAIPAGGTALASSANATPVASPDAELIRICQQFTESEMAKWYRLAISDEDNDENSGFDTVRKIVDMPAMTPEGWRAKAVAYSAWDEPAYSGSQSADISGDFLTSILRDMAGQARIDIIARLAAVYGPLPDRYTADGTWLGYTDEEREAIDARWGQKVAEIEAKRAAEMAELKRKTNIETMTRDELKESLPGIIQMRERLRGMHQRMLDLLAGDVA